MQRQRRSGTIEGCVSRGQPTGLRGFANVAVPWIVGIFGTLVALGEGENGAPPGVVLLLLAIAVGQGVAMRWRRTHPIPVTAVALVTGLAVLAISPDSVMPVAGYFAVGALASVFPPRVSLFGLAGVTAVASLNFFTVNAEDAAFAIVLGFGAWALGEAARNRRVVIHEEARRAVADEQARIARDVHDVVAHSVSVIVVQAAAADDVFESVPTRRAPRCARSSRPAAMRCVSSVWCWARCGPTPAAAEHEPQPGLDRLDELAEPLRAGGLDVVMRREGSGRPPGRRRPVRVPHRPGGPHEHVASRAGDAGRGRAEAGPDALEVDVRDNGRPPAGRRGRPRARGHARARHDARRDLRSRAAAGRRLPGSRPSPARGGPVSIGVVIADDQGLVRGGFRMILDARDDIDVTGEAADGAAAVELVEQLEPNVVLMDVRMPGMDGIEATRRIAAAGSESRVVVLTTYDLDEYVFAAVRAGASGFLLKDVRPAELVDAVRVVAAGEALLAPSATRRLLDRFAGALPDPRPAARDARAS